MHYIPLKVKTNYSLLNSLIDIKKLISYCKDNNINEIGICDNNLFGAMDFYTLCIENNIKPIIGLEINVEDKEILLYAKNYEGYQNLCFITSNDKSIDVIKENSSNLICILPFESLEVYDKYSEIFDDIFVSYNSKEQRDKITGKKCIFLNDIRCLEKDETDYIKYAYMIKDGKKISDEGEYNFEDNYLKLNPEIDKNDLINYKIINSSINIEIKHQDNLLPKFSEEENFNEKLYLEKLCKKGLLKRFDCMVPVKYATRLEYELNMIDKMGFNNYFLVVWDFVKYAKKNNILVGPGRGSAAGSLVSYSLGITNVDPIKYDLFFERFLNPERVTMPDIDIDFDSTRREEVIDYVKERYGKEKVANIVTFGTLKAKQVLRDVSRIFDVDIEDFIKLFSSSISLEENKKNNIEIKTKLNTDTLLSRIYDISLHLENLNRHASINAAGVVISSEELDRYIPVYSQSGTTVTGYTINHLENLGFLKMDFLALDNLVLLSNLTKEIGNINLNDIPLDDKKTIDIFKTVNTDGIFQFESLGMKNTLKKFNVSSFDDIVALLALYRPGPMDNIDTYIKRKEGKEKIEYVHESLKDILKSTYGIIIYQEQIMQIVQKVASFSLGEADILRRAMSKKKKEIMDMYKEKFINGAINNGYTKEKAIEIYNLIYKFANYGFNKAHSVSYALVSYYLAYLKANYFPYFMRHLLTMVNGNEYKTKDYIMECKNKNIKILKPDINKSFNEYTLENDSIRYSLFPIKNIGTTISNQIIKERIENGDYKDFFDFVSRCKKNINKKNIVNLIHAGCFDSFGYNHNTFINNIDEAFNYAELINDIDESFIEKPELKLYEEFSKEELVKNEFEVFGYYLSNHPVQNKRKNKVTTNDIKDYFNKNINIYLIIDKKKEILTKNGDRMAFLVGSDEFNSIEMVMFPKLYEKKYTIKKGDIVLVNAKVEKRFNEYQLIINNIDVEK